MAKVIGTGKTITLEITLHEAAMLYAVLGATSAGRAASLMEMEFGAETAEYEFEHDTGYGVFETLKEALTEEDML